MKTRTRLLIFWVLMLTVSIYLIGANIYFSPDGISVALPIFGAGPLFLWSVFMIIHYRPIKEASHD